MDKLDIAMFTGYIVLYAGLMIWLVTGCRIKLLRRKNKITLSSFKSWNLENNKNGKRTLKIFLLVIIFIACFLTIKKNIAFLLLMIEAVLGTSLIEEKIEYEIEKSSDENYIKKIVNLRYIWRVGMLIISLGCLILMVVRTVQVLSN
ncbi:MAG: hypothetical protein ABF991_11010 [Liquorilactobacillus hordei]|uniref:Uncharacterized protein n=1 Tax=Liquorilactobacillus hordei TaxID=468911 RepID=A0A3Q8CY18_9LACO|nr:hypothetical protein [Liquorilactobacillus hordei]AUJ30456.1 hypothetical protein BSQ49_09835 [Liquorilactobacillus hordei]